MNWKTPLQRQLHRIQKIAAPASIALLVANLSLAVYPFIEWRGLHPYTGFGLIFGGLLGLVLLIANVYTVTMRMYVHERRTLIEHNPVEVYAMTPYQTVERLEWGLPMLRAQIALHDQLGLDTAALEAVEAKWQRWANLGHIPRDEYPEALRGYYKGDGGRL